jgi:hypothetical protein
MYPSDLRLKENVRSVEMALDKVNRLRGITFSWNELGLEYLTGDIEATLTLGPDASEAENQRLWEEIQKHRSAKLAGNQIGFVAQEVEQVLPEVVSTDEEGYKFLDYTKLTAVLVEAIKEQNAQIQALSSKVAALEAV